MYAISAGTAIISLPVQHRTPGTKRACPLLQVAGGVYLSRGEWSHMDLKSALVVDDQAIIRDVLIKILTRHGFAVMPVNSGRQALDMCRKSKETVTLAVIDLMLPDGAGRKTAIHVRRICPDAVIILTGSEAGMDIEKLLAATGADSYVAKPYSSRQLMAAVREAYEKRDMLAGRGKD